MPVRVLDREGRGNAVDIAKGIRFAVAHHAQVINMSFNFDCGKRVPMVDEALREAYERGRRHRRLGRQPRLGELRLGAGDRAAGDRRRRHHRGRLPRRLLAGRHGDRPGRPGRRRAASGCPSVAARPIYQVTLKAGQHRRPSAIPANYVGTSMAAAHVSGVAAMVLASRQ